MKILWNCWCNCEEKKKSCLQSSCYFHDHFTCNFTHLKHDCFRATKAALISISNTIEMVPYDKLWNLHLSAHARLQSVVSSKGLIRSNTLLSVAFIGCYLRDLFTWWRCYRAQKGQQQYSTGLMKWCNLWKTCS